MAYPGKAKPKRIVDNHYKDKGIQISPDEKWIYIADFGGRKVYRYPLMAPGVLGEGEVFIDRMCGGIALDEHGNLYISTIMDGAGLCVYNPDGELMGQILVPDCTSNVTFAGPDFKTLIITTFESVYALEMQVRGFAW